MVISLWEFITMPRSEDSCQQNGYGDAQAITEIKAGQVSKVKVEVGSGK